MRRLDRRGERGGVAIAAVALLLLLALVAGASLTAGRGLVIDERVHSAADAAALAAASVLEQRYGEAVDSGGGPATLRATERAAHVAAERVAERLGATLVAIRFERGARDPSPLAVRVRVMVNTDHSASARAGIGFAQPVAAEGFRVADVRGLDTAGAVVAAALAQLGWPYVWGGESRAEGGFDCSGLVDYALAAAGLPVGRLTAAGLQELARPLPVGAGLLAGDLVFVGEPAHHVGLVVAPGLAVEAPRRGATVHVESLGDGGWTGAGRILLPGTGAPAEGGGELAVPAYVPVPLRPLIARAARAEQLPPALLAAQLEAESGFDASARSPAGAQGMAQFMPPTWSGDWNPQRERSPFEPGPAIAAQARLMHLLLERSGGDVASALAAYNAGPAVLPGEWPRETRAYVARVMRRFGGPMSLGAAVPPEVVAAGATPASGRMQVRLLP
jgi:cell wall-associated NlpC family hydrolase